MAFDYQPTVWANGDLITDDKLNNAEEGLDVVADIAATALSATEQLETDLAEFKENVVTLEGEQSITGAKSFEQTIAGNISGNAATATALANARTIRTNLASEDAAAFDGSTNITPGVVGVLDITHGGTGNSTGDISGNAASADKLSTARTVQVNLASTNASSFDGTADIMPGVTGILAIENGGTGNTSGNAATASKLEDPRTITLSSAVTGSATFDGSADVTISTTLRAAAEETIGGVAVPTDSGLTVDGSGNLTIDFSSMSTEALADLIKQIIEEDSGLGISDAGKLTVSSVDLTDEQVSEIIEKTVQNITTTTATISELTSLIIDQINSLADTAELKINITGSAATADALTNAVQIQTNLASSGAAEFDGSSDVTPGVTGILPITNGGTGNSTGNAVTATRLLNNRLISLEDAVTGSASFNGSADVYISTELRAATDEDIGGVIIPAASGLSIDETGNLSVDISSLSEEAQASLADLVVEQINASEDEELNVDITGNAATADALSTPRSIQTDLGSTEAAYFDGTENITPGIKGVLDVEHGGTGNSVGNVPGNAETATALITPRSVLVDLASNEAEEFDGTSGINPGVTGVLSIENGGTGNNEGNVPGNAATATALYSAKNLMTSLDSTDAASFDGTEDVYIGVRGVLGVEYGGTGNQEGNVPGNAASATKLYQSAPIQVNLSSTTNDKFNGLGECWPGVTGTLAIGNGGTGAASASAALANLGGVLKAGSRGTLAGYQTVATSSDSSLTINSSSADTTVWTTSGSRTLSFTAADSSYCGVKVIACSASAATTLTVSNALLANNDDAPDWGSSGEILILTAYFIAGRVVLSVFHNSEA